MSKTILFAPKAIFFASRTILFVSERIFFVSKRIFFVSKSLVRNSQSFAHMNLRLFNRASPFRSWLFSELQPALIIIIREIHQLIRYIQTVFALCTICQVLLFTMYHIACASRLEFGSRLLAREIAH
jgi:hypothetical protein